MTGIFSMVINKEPFNICKNDMQDCYYAHIPHRAPNITNNIIYMMVEK